MVYVKGDDGLSVQDLSTLDVSALNPLSPEIISRQATINIGTIGHVAHGKSTVVKAISGVQTVRFKNELERNITIKLGYANAKIYECEDPKCPRPDRYCAYPSSKRDDPDCLVKDFQDKKMKLIYFLKFLRHLLLLIEYSFILNYSNFLPVPVRSKTQSFHQKPHLLGTHLIYEELS